MKRAEFCQGTFRISPQVWNFLSDYTSFIGYLRLGISGEWTVVSWKSRRVPQNTGNCQSPLWWPLQDSSGTSVNLPYTDQCVKSKIKVGRKSLLDEIRFQDTCHIEESLEWQNILSVYTLVYLYWVNNHLDFLIFFLIPESSELEKYKYQRK